MILFSPKLGFYQVKRFDQHFPVDLQCYKVNLMLSVFRQTFFWTQRFTASVYWGYTCVSIMKNTIFYLWWQLHELTLRIVLIQLKLIFLLQFTNLEDNIEDLLVSVWLPPPPLSYSQAAGIDNTKTKKKKFFDSYLTGAWPDLKGWPLDDAQKWVWFWQNGTQSPRLLGCLDVFHLFYLR